MPAFGDKSTSPRDGPIFSRNLSTYVLFHQNRARKKTAILWSIQPGISPGGSQPKESVAGCLSGAGRAEVPALVHRCKAPREIVRLQVWGGGTTAPRDKQERGKKTHQNQAFHFLKTCWLVGGGRPGHQKPEESRRLVIGGGD